MDQYEINDLCDGYAEEIGDLKAEIERLRQEAADAKEDALRMHSEKMRYFDGLLEIKCGQELTGAECMAIATRVLEQSAREGSK